MEFLKNISGSLKKLFWCSVARIDPSNDASELVVDDDIPELEEPAVNSESVEVVEEMENVITQKLKESKSKNSEYDQNELKNIEKELKKMGYI